MSTLQHRIVWVIGLAALLALAPQIALGQATPEGESSTARTFELPGDQVYPEGVTYQESTGSFYVGSTTDGTIFRGDVQSGSVEILIPGGGPLPTAIGMEITDDGHLIVAGGGSGNVFVIDAASGQVVRQLTNGLSEGTFLNDVTVVPGGDAYVTDSMTSILYRVPLDAGAAAAADGSGTPVATEQLEEFLDFTGTPAEYTEGFNLNGIVSTPDGEYLIVVKSNSGQLFRIEIASQEVTEITGLDEPVTAGDGLVLDGTTLYVVRNQMGIIAVVDLADDYSSGTLLGDFSDPSFAFPTTADNYDGCLLVVNAQFNARESGDPSLPFTVVGVPIPQEFAAPGSPTPMATC